MTGIEALERVAPTRSMKPGQDERREFEYKRHGTQGLIGNFAVATGEGIAPTVQATRTEEDFVQHIAGAVATDAEAGGAFVADTRALPGAGALAPFVARTRPADRVLDGWGSLGFSPEHPGEPRCPRLRPCAPVGAPMRPSTSCGGSAWPASSRPASAPPPSAPPKAFPCPPCTPGAG